MVKVAIQSEKLSPFGGIFSIMEQFDSKLSSVIDSTLGMKITGGSQSRLLLQESLRFSFRLLWRELTRHCLPHSQETQGGA